MSDGNNSSVRWTGIIWQVSHLGGGGIFLIILWAVLGRYWSPDGFGEFNYIFAYIAISGIFMDFGLDVLLTRHLSLSKQKIPANYWYLKQYCSVIFSLLFFFLGYLLAIPLEVLILLLIGSLSLSLTAFLNALIRARDQLHIEAKIGIVQKSIFIFTSIYGVSQFNQGMLWVALCYAVSHIFALLLTFFIIQKKNLNRNISMDYPDNNPAIKTLFITALPLFLVALLNVLTLRIDIFILQALLGENAVGLYTAAMRLIEGIIVVGSAYQAAIFPKLVNQLNDPEQFNPLFKKAVFHLLIGACFIVVGGILLGPWMIRWLYGEAFVASIEIFILLLPVIVFVYQTTLFGNVIIAMAQQNHYLIILLLVLIVNMIADYFLILSYGVIGAAMGFWIKEVVLLLLLGYYLVKQYFITEKRTV